MTKIERGDVDARTVTAPRYTFCKKCRLSVCVDCWDCVTLELEKLVASTRGLMMHDVYNVLLMRAYRTYTLRCRGFEPLDGGGGTWLSQCPLCVVIKFEPPSPPVPLTISGRKYGNELPVILATKRIAMSWRVWQEDATLGIVLKHSVEVIVVKQLVDDAQCLKCFRCVCPSTGPLTDLQMI